MDGLGREKLETDAAQEGKAEATHLEMRKLDEEAGRQALESPPRASPPLSTISTLLDPQEFPPLPPLVPCTVILLLSQKLTITGQLLTSLLTPSFFQSYSVCVSGRKKLTRFRNLSVGANLLCTHFEFSWDGWT